MTTQTISVEFPSDIFLTLNETEQELKQRIKIAVAIQLYQQQKTTIGKAAQIAEMTRFQFENFLSKQGISISNLEEEDILADMKKLK